MDNNQNSELNGSQGENSGHHLWLAALIIGLVLLLMLLAIVAIVIWRYYQKLHTMDNIWARPYPITDGNIQDNMRINKSILSRQMSFSSTAPIVFHEFQATEQCNTPDHNPAHGKEQEANNIVKINIPDLVLNPPTYFQPEGPASMQHPPPFIDQAHLPTPPHSASGEMSEEADYQQPLPLSNAPQIKDHHKDKISQAGPVRMHSVNSTHSTDEFFPAPQDGIF